MDATPETAAQRFVAIDAHKAYVMIGAVDAQQNVVLEPRRVDLAQFPTWIAKNLAPSDAVALEVTTTAWHLYDQLCARGCAVVIANPLAVKLIAETAVKTDRRDTLTLARLLACGFLPTIWVPPLHVRQLRNLVARRERLVRQRTQARNRLHAILIRHAIVVPEGGLFTARQRAWWEGLSLDPDERLVVRQDLAWLDTLAEWIAELERELARLSATSPWDQELPFLPQLPGMGTITAMTVLSAVGDIGRFPSAKKLVGYAGLGSSVHRSGTEQYGGRITKQGRKELRTAMVEVAWRAVTTSAYWEEQFRPLARRLGDNKAIVAIARKLLMAVWHVLTKAEADRFAEPARVARKLLTYTYLVGRVNRRPGQSTAQWVREQLDRLKLGAKLTEIDHGRRPIALPPSTLTSKLT